MKKDEIKDTRVNEEENAVEKKEAEILESDVNNEEFHENKVLIEDCEDDDKEEHVGKRTEFINQVLVMIMDQMVMLSISVLALIVFSYLIKFVGYRVVMPVPILFIIYFIVGCLYMPIFKQTKWKNTLGQKLMNIN